MNTPRIGVAAVALHDGCILLVQRGNEPGAKRWSVPGGHLEFGEELHEAVLREFREETGLDAVVDRYLGHVERMGDTPVPYHYVILDFVVDVLDTNQAIVPGDDALDASWVDLADIASWDLVDGLYEFLVDTGIVPDARTFSI